MAEKEKEGKKPRSKSKHANIKLSRRYKDGKMLGRFCPRCGPGVILAQHKSRVTCGKCGYSEINNQKK
jgi:ubiquitin-small subunit ribosomal protein S27Ae